LGDAEHVIDCTTAIDTSLMEELLKSASNSDQYQDVLLVMLGSARNLEDEELVAALEQDVCYRGLHCNVHIYTNTSYEMLLYCLNRAEIGLHTMWNEHFGISVVEMMAVGLVVVAHDSGGPKSDILAESCTG
jgi:alpha-1,2-mannosyltransferase